MSARSRFLPGSMLVLAAVPALLAGDTPRKADRYRVTNLVSDGEIDARTADADLVNAWGIAFNPNGPVWVSDNETGVSTLYDGTGAKQQLVVRVNPLDGEDPPSAPTGIVFAGGNDFQITNGANTGAARFIFVTEGGTIAAWAPNVDGLHALVQVDNSDDDAIYKGLALGGDGGGHRLYATDFHNARVDVFDDHFQPITVPGGFRDSFIPRGFAPFGIQNILGTLFVTFAKQDEDGEDDVTGPGLGFVDEFDADGHLIRRFVARGKLNAPWGMALAPGNFGEFANAILIGNFGDGRINAFELESGRHLGQLREPNGRPVVIDGLWGLAFGNGVARQPTSTLFFTAGPDDEEHGIYGRLDPVNCHGHNADDCED